jgi:hypothetical protein
MSGNFTLARPSLPVRRQQTGLSISQRIDLNQLLSMMEIRGMIVA